MNSWSNESCSCSSNDVESFDWFQKINRTEITKLWLRLNKLWYYYSNNCFDHSDLHAFHRQWWVIQWWLFLLVLFAVIDCNCFSRIENHFDWLFISNVISECFWKKINWYINCTVETGLKRKFFIKKCWRPNA